MHSRRTRYSPGARDDESLGGRIPAARKRHPDRRLPLISADELGGDPDNILALFRRLGGQRAALFIDEISLIAQAREYSGIDDRRMLAALLTCLDGLSSGVGPKRLWVIGACTPDVQLDRALYRAGRLGVVIEFVPPSEEQRLQLFHLYLDPVPHAVSDEELGSLAEMANGATGADIRDWVSQAASEVLAEAGGTNEPVIGLRHLQTVVACRGFVASERPEREPTWEMAVHEAGHAVSCHAVFGREALARVQLGIMRHGQQFATMSVGHFEMSSEWYERNPPNLNGLGDVATHLHHLGLILRAPINTCNGVLPWVNRPVWARSSL